MTIQDEDISDYTEEIWLSYLQLEAKTTHEPFNLNKDNYMTGRVNISGTWDGIIVVDCARDLIRKMAAQIFGHLGDVSNEDEIDNFKELTNMIGGNIKTHLPQPCQLAIPTVSDAADPEEFTNMNLLTKVNFNSCDSQFRVSIYKQI
ncbi:MAG: chemotaxis protein CheX [Nitrospinales bacterium]